MNDRQRLEAIVAVVCKYLPPDGISREQAIGEIIGLIDPLPPQEQEQEPATWMDDYNACKCSDNETRCFSDRVFRMMQKYTTPPQRTWVGLTDEELSILGESFTHPDEGIDEVDFGMEIQRILKEKNT